MKDLGFFSSTVVNDYVYSLLLSFLFLLVVYSGSTQTSIDLDTTLLKRKLFETKNDLEKIPILKNLVTANSSINNKNVEKYISDLQEIAERENLPDILGYIFEKNATLEYFDSNFDLAREKFVSSYNQYMIADSFDLAYIAWTKSGVMYSIQSDYQKAELIYRKIQKEITKETHPRANAFLQNNLGTLYHYIGNIDSADYYYTKAIDNYSKLKDTVGMLRPMQNQSLFWNGEKAIGRLIEIADLRRAMKNYADLLNTLNALSDVEVVDNNNFERSLLYATEAYTLSKKVENHHFTFKSLINLGRVSQFQQDYDQAFSYFTEASHIAFANDFKESILTSYLCFGRLNQEQNNKVEAEEYFIKAKKLNDEIGDNRLTAIVYLELAEAYFLNNKNHLIDKLLEKAIKFAKLTNDNTRLRYCYILKSRILLENNKSNEALKYIKITESNTEPTDLFSNVEFYELSSKVYEKNGMYKKSLYALNQFKLFSDSLNNQNNIRQLTINQKNFEFAQEKEILAVEQEKKEAILKAESKQFKTTALGVGALALLALGFFWNSRRKNKVIAKANRELEALNNTKDQIFSIIGHDLKKPVIAFRGITQKIKYLIKSGDEQRLIKFGESIEKDALQLNSLTDNLLSWALLQKDLITFNEEKINLTELSEEVVGLFANIAREKNIELKSNVADISVQSDKNALMTVLRNLIDNALKYTDENGEVTVLAHQTDNKVELLVKDNGRGIAQEQIPKLFLLTKEKSTRGTADEKGTGLGLHIVKDLVEKCKGTIEVESTLGHGTTFTLALPSI